MRADSGGCDAKSALPIADNASNFETAAGGGYDGVYNATAIRPGSSPNLNMPGSYGTLDNTKPAAVNPVLATTEGQTG